MKTGEEIRQVEWEEVRPAARNTRELFLIMAEFVEGNWQIWERRSRELKWNLAAPTDLDRVRQDLVSILSYRRQKQNFAHRPDFEKRSSKHRIERPRSEKLFEDRRCLVSCAPFRRLFHSRNSLIKRDRCPARESAAYTVAEPGEINEDDGQDEDDRPNESSTLRRGRKLSYAQ